MKRFEAKEITIDGFDVIELFSDNQSAFIVLDIGNTLYRWTWGDKSLIWFPYSLESYMSSEKLAGNPLVYPWANRLATDDFLFDGQEYPLNSDVLYRDVNGYALHGLLLKSGKWTTKEIDSDDKSAWHIAEYHCTEHAEIFSQFPFKHRLEMTHRMEEDGIEVILNIINESDVNIPISFGFHPYFSLENYDRDEIQLHVPFRHHVLTNKHLLPTGDVEDIEAVIPGERFTLGKYFLDDGFIHRIVGQHPSFETTDYKVEIVFDEQYACCVVYAPPAEEKKYLCIEPMILPTNGLQKSIADITVPIVTPHSSRDFTFKMKVSSKNLSEDI